MIGNDDRHGGDDGFDDDIHFSDEELEAALDGFEKEFRDSNAAAGEPANDAAADSPADDAGAADSGQAQEADTAAAFDDELQGLLGNKAKAAVLITRVASARLLAAFCQLSDVSADCIGSEEGAVAILRNLDGDGPEVAARDLTIVVSGMSLVLAVNRADKLEAGADDRPAVAVHIDGAVRGGSAAWHHRRGRPDRHRHESRTVRGSRP